MDSVSAYMRIAPYIRRTPVVSLNLGNTRLLLKLENLQKTRSFKVRGAFNKLLKLGKVEGVVVASAGNHAQAVARACRELGVERIVVVVPEGTPRIKKEAILKWNVELLEQGKHLNESISIAKSISESEKLLFIHPYDDEDVIEGQGTLGVELLNYEFSYLLAPVGGGGLLSGISSVLRKYKPKVKMYGVVSANAPSFYYSFKQGKILSFEPKDTLADGIKLKSVSERTFNILKENLDDVFMVSEDAIKQAIKLLYNLTGQVVEGAGAVSLASVLEGSLHTNETIMLIVSGGNIDESILDSLLKASS